MSASWTAAGRLFHTTGPQQERRNILGCVSPTSIKSRISWTRFKLDRRWCKAPLVWFWEQDSNRAVTVTGQWQGSDSDGDGAVTVRGQWQWRRRSSDSERAVTVTDSDSDRAVTVTGQWQWEGSGSDSDRAVTVTVTGQWEGSDRAVTVRGQWQWQGSDSDRAVRGQWQWQWQWQWQGSESGSSINEWTNVLCRLSVRFFNLTVNLGETHWADFIAHHRAVTFLPRVSTIHNSWKSPWICVVLLEIFV